MSFVRAKDGVEIFYKDWGHGQPIFSIMAGRSAQTTGIPKYCSSSTMAIA
jgi:hypothetical protein